jgi:hypothetical protein
MKLSSVLYDFGCLRLTVVLKRKNAPMLMLKIKLIQGTTNSDLATDYWGVVLVSCVIDNADLL